MWGRSRSAARRLRRARALVIAEEGRCKSWAVFRQAPTRPQCDVHHYSALPRRNPRSCLASGPPITGSGYGSERRTTRSSPPDSTAGRAPSKGCRAPTQTIVTSPRLIPLLPCHSTPWHATFKPHPTETTIIKHHSNLVLEITGNDPDTIEGDLNTAVEVARTRAMRERRNGILVTQHGYTTYKVVVSRDVPYGQTHEVREIPEHPQKPRPTQRGE